MITPVSRSPIEPRGTVESEPWFVVAIGRGNNHADHWGWSVHDTPRRWRRIIVSRRNNVGINGAVVDSTYRFRRRHSESVREHAPASTAMFQLDVQ